MGSLLLGGALTGLGRGISKDAENKVKAEAADEDREHDRQLEAMRQRFLSESQQAGFEHQETMYETQAKATLGAATTRREHEETMYGIESGATLEAADLLFSRNSKLQMNELTYSEWKTNADNESDEFQAMMSGWWRDRTGKAGTKRKAGEWDVEFKDGMDMETGAPTVTMFATHPDGTTMEKFGNRMIEAGGTQDDRDKGMNSLPDPAKRNAAEFMLMNGLKDGKDTSEEFLRQFKYLPSAYFRAKFEQDDSTDMQQFMQHFQRTRSRPQYGGQQPRSTPDRIADEAATGTISDAQPPPVKGRLTQGGQLEAEAAIEPAPAPAPAPAPSGQQYNAQGIPIVDTSARDARKVAREEIMRKNTAGPGGFR